MAAARKAAQRASGIMAAAACMWRKYGRRGGRNESSGVARSGGVWLRNIGLRRSW